MAPSSSVMKLPFTVAPLVAGLLYCKKCDHHWNLYDAITRKTRLKNNK